MCELWKGDGAKEYDTQKTIALTGIDDMLNYCIIQKRLVMFNKMVLNSIFNVKHISQINKLKS